MALRNYLTAILLWNIGVMRAQIFAVQNAVRCPMHNTFTLHTHTKFSHSRQTLSLKIARHLQRTRLRKKLESPGYHQQNHNQQNEANATTRVISTIAAVRPCGKDARQKQDQHHQQDDTQHGTPPQKVAQSNRAINLSDQRPMLRAGEMARLYPSALNPVFEHLNIFRQAPGKWYDAVTVRALTRQDVQTPPYLHHPAPTCFSCIKSSATTPT